MRKYRIRENSIADWARMLALSFGFVGALFWAIVTAYPV